MSSVRALVAGGVAAACLAVAATGCGGEDAGPAGASVVPADVALYVAVNSDFDSEQWENVRAIVDRFPDGERLTDRILADFSDEGVDFEEDVRPAVGPEVDLVAFDLADEEGSFVLLTQPEDEQKLDDLLEKGDEPAVVREMDGWSVIAEDETTLDEFERRREAGRLADSGEFRDAMATVSDDSLVRAYFSGEALAAAAAQGSDVPPGALEACVPGGQIPSFALAASAEANGIRFEGGGKLEREGEEGFYTPYEAQLPDVVPAGALLYFSFNDLEQTFSALRDCLAATSPDFERDLAQIESRIGVSFEEDIAPLFANEGALYVRQGSPLPEVTLLLEVDDEAAAMETVEDLLQGVRALDVPVPQPRDADIAGADVRELPVAPFVSIFYGAFDGRFVLTSARAGISELREEGAKLADDDGFRTALDEAGVPDETVGFFYANLEETLSYALGFAPATGAEAVPPEVERNTEPLEQLVFYSTEDGEVVRFAGFLSVE